MPNGGSGSDPSIKDVTEIISRNEARAKAWPRFFIGEPCLHGHVSERKTADGSCVQCHRDRARTWQRNYRDPAYEKPNPNGDVEFITWRKRLGLTQVQLAEALGLSRGSIQNYERTKEIPRIVRLAMAYLMERERLIVDDRSAVIQQIVEKIQALWPNAEPKNGPENEEDTIWDLAQEIFDLMEHPEVMSE